MMNSRLYTLFIILIFVIPLWAQEEAPQKKRRSTDTESVKERLKSKNQPTQTAEDDTSGSQPFSEQDTLATQPVNSRMFWYTSANRLYERKQFSNISIWNEKYEKQQSYTDISDIFRQQPLWYDFDLKETGRQVYLAGINSFPHQTAVYFNGIMMNDPLHGMFNGQFVPFNYLRQIEPVNALPGAGSMGYGGRSALYINPNSRHTKAVWTKLVYKEGVYGYSDVDITFVKPVSPDISLQLGGINNIYDGAYGFGASFAQTTNYRAELTWQLTPDIFIKSMAYFNRFKAGLVSNDLPTDPEFPRQTERRNDYFTDLTWVLNDSLKKRLHATVYHTNSKRHVKNLFGGGYRADYFYDRYGVNADYNLFFLGSEIIFGGGLAYSKVWGDPFLKTYDLYLANGYSQVYFPVSQRIAGRADLQFMINEEHDFQFSPAVNLDFDISETDRLSLQASRGVRFPNATEQFFSYDTLFGNPALLYEEFLNASVAYDTKISERIGVKTKLSVNRVSNEIIWQEPNFSNGPDRKFAAVSMDVGYSVWKIDFRVGGFQLFADVNLTAENGGWIKLHYHDFWFKKALEMDLYGTLQYSGSHRNINYESRLERFYLATGRTDAYWVADWKAVATVKGARIFFEMDNSFGTQYEVINGHPELSQRWRFGVYWTFWD